MNFILKRLLQRKEKNQTGATAVEFAIVILLFITIVFGIIEFGLLMYNQHIVTNAAREGARYGIVSRTERITESEIESRVLSYINQNLVTFGTFPTNVDSNECTEFGESLSVTITYKYSFLFFRFLERTISSTTTMRCE